MKYFGEKFGRLKKGNDGAFTHMNTNIIKTLKIPVPDMAIQNTFDTILKSLENQKQQALIQINSSETLFQSFLQKAFKGELVN